MLKKYEDCKLKGLILNQIHNGTVTAKGIYTNIGYKGHIDSLYTELNFLTKYGYLSQRKIGIISNYTLTKKGLKHFQNPSLFKQLKNDRFNKTLRNEVENTLRNELKVKEWAMKFANEIAEHPVHEHIHKSPDIINSGGKTVEFIDTNTHQHPQISDAQKRLDEIIALLAAQPQMKKVEQKRLRDEQRGLIDIRNREKSKALWDAQDKRVADAIKNKDKPEPVKIDSKPLNTGCKNCEEKDKTIEWITKQRDELKAQAIANSPLYNTQIKKVFIDAKGNEIEPQKAIQRFKKGYERKERDSKKDAFRERLFREYKGKYLDYAFFKKYEQMPYWIPDLVNALGVVDVGIKWFIQILPPGSDEVGGSKFKQQGHAKPLTANEIADAEFKVISIEPTTGWRHVMGRGMKTFKRM